MDDDIIKGSKKTLIQDKALEWKDAAGNNILLCAFHEFNPLSTLTAQAITVLMGTAVCRYHAEMLIKDSQEEPKATVDELTLSYVQDHLEADNA